MLSLPTGSSVNASCYGTEAFWVLLIDTEESAPRLTLTVISSILFGIATCLALASAYILFGKGRVQKAPLILIFATLVLYASTTVFWATTLHKNVLYTREATAAAAAVSNCDVQALFNPVRTAAINDRMSCIQTALLTINIIVGDGVVWWRASLLWSGRSKYAILTLCSLLLLATFAISTADTCGACQLELVRNEAGFGQLFTGDRFGAAASILSLVTNLIATLLTGYKAWVHARLLRTYFSGGTMITNVERILILLTESGLIYVTIWVAVTVYQIGVNTGDVYDTSMTPYATNFWGVIGYFVNGALVPIIAIYPMTIIVLVALKKSQIEHSFSTTRTSMASTPMVLSTQIPTSPTSATRTSRAFTVTSPRRDSQRTSMYSNANGMGRPQVVMVGRSWAWPGVKEEGTIPEVKRGGEDV